MNPDPDRLMRALLHLDALLAHEGLRAELCWVAERGMALAVAGGSKSRDRDYASESALIRMLIGQVRQ